MTTTLDCAAVRELLSGYLDGELLPEQAREVARHVAGCAACAAELERAKQVSATMREHVRPVAAPDLLRARVRAALRDTRPDSGAPPAPRLARWPRQIAAGLIIAVVSSTVTVGVMKYSPSAAEPGAEQVLATHVRSLMANRLTDVQSNDQHNVKPWFNGKTGFSPEVYRFDSLGFPLVGGRVDTVGGRTVAALVYGRRLHIINVFTWPQDGAGSADSVAASRGYNALHWTHAGMAFWAVSDLNVAELSEFVSAFRSAER